MKKEAALKKVKAKDLDLKQTDVVTDGAPSAGEKGTSTLHLARRQDVLFADLEVLQKSRACVDVEVLGDDGECSTVPMKMLPLVWTFFDPWSYTATVENLFYFSFLVKAGYASVQFARPVGSAADAPFEPFVRALEQEEFNALMNKKTGAAAAAAAAADPTKRARAPPPTAAATEKAEAKKRAMGRSSQFSIEIDQVSWAALVKAKGIVTAAVGHREYSDCRGCEGVEHAAEKKAGEVAGVTAGAGLDEEEEEGGGGAGAGVGAGAGGGARAKRARVSRGTYAEDAAGTEEEEM